MQTSRTDLGDIGAPPVGVVPTVHPMLRRDRPWVDAYVTIVAGPFEMPSLEALREAVAAVAERRPDSRLRWGFDNAKRRWLTDRPLESIVVERDWAGESGFGGTLLDTVTNDVSLEPPLTLVRYPNHFGMKMSHSLGDGLIFVSVVAAALLTAVSGEVIPWPTVAGGRLPLLRAGLRTFARKPALVRATLRDRVQLNAEEPHGPSRPWQRSRRAICLSLPPEKSDEIYSWAARYTPGGSRFTIQTALLLRALRRVGMRISDDVRVMVDLRAYLGSGLIDGNFFAGVPMAINWDMTPQEIAAIVKTTKATGRPLANQLMTSVRLGLAPAAPTTAEDGRLPQVTFSYLGSPPQVEWLPYISGHRPIYAASVEPGGPHGLTFIQGHCRGHMILNACFHDNVVDRATVQTAMDLVGDDPIGLLSEQVATA